MGYYIDPVDRTKEKWLEENGTRVSEIEVLKHDFKSSTLPVCLVFNPQFSAAGIAWCREEADEFLRHDGRPKQWFLVLKSDLKPYYQEAKNDQKNF